VKGMEKVIKKPIEFNSLYNEAIRNGYTSFIYDGMIVDVSFAKYVIEYFKNNNVPLTNKPQPPTQTQVNLDGVKEACEAYLKASNPHPDDIVRYKEIIADSALAALYGEETLAKFQK
jgi:hypothetical protein